LQRGVRGVGDGFVSLVLPVYLLELGNGPFRDRRHRDRHACRLGACHPSRRTLLISAGLLMVLTGIAFAALEDFWPLLLVPFVGTLNPSLGDVSVFLPRH
jgi:hypothetical protein